jgi:hypothetical protein
MKRFGIAILWIIGIYFVVRAIAEPFVIDLNDPATYRHDWGGPSLTGVLLVHCGLGLVAAALMAWRLTRRASVRLRRGTGRTPPDRTDPEPGRPSVGAGPGRTLSRHVPG